MYQVGERYEFVAGGYDAYECWHEIYARTSGFLIREDETLTVYSLEGEITRFCTDTAIVRMPTDLSRQWLTPSRGDVSGGLK